MRLFGYYKRNNRLPRRVQGALRVLQPLHLGVPGGCRGAFAYYKSNKKRFQGP